MVARQLHLKPGPMVVSALRPPAHDPFAMAVRPAFLDPFGPPDDHLPPPMSEEEFNRLQKGYKSRLESSFLNCSRENLLKATN